MTGLPFAQRLVPVLALTLSGCGGKESSSAHQVEHQAEAPALRLGPVAPEPPIVGSMLPVIPDAAIPDLDKIDGAKRAHPGTEAQPAPK